MAIEPPTTHRSRLAIPLTWRGPLAALVAAAVGWSGLVYAANQSVQGAKKTEEFGFGGVRRRS